MTARTTRTVRIVAGSSAAALVMCTVSLVGTANAAVADQTGTTGIRPIPTQNPNATTGFQNAPFVTTSAQGAKVNDFQVTIGNQWKTGDALAVVLPAGVTFAGTPTVTVEGPTTQQSIRENARTQVVNPQNAVRAPEVTAALDTAPAANGGVVRVTFNNDASETPTPALRYVLNFTGVSVNTSTNAAQGALTANVFGIDRTGVTPIAPAGTPLATTTLAFITNLAVGVTSTPVIPGGGAQTIGNITLAEKTPEALVDGRYTFSFTTGPAGPAGTPGQIAVPVLNPNPAGGDFDVKVTGDADLQDGAATAANNTLTLPLTSLNADGALEAFAVSGVRLNPPAGSGPIRVTLTAIDGAVVTSNTTIFDFTAVNNPNATPANDGSNNGAGQQAAESRVPNRAGILAGSIGVLPQDQRIGGNDRYQTAAQIASQLADGRTVNTIVIASGEPGSGGVDALSANYLAGALADGAVGTNNQPVAGANDNPVPVLLTQQAKLTDVTAVAINNLFRGRQNQNEQAKIYVVGGENAVSAETFAAIQIVAANATRDRSAFSVQRVGGNDRYATAANTATVLGEQAVGSYNPGFSQGAGNTVFLSNGLTPADALSAGPIAYRNNFPVLLTRQGEIPAATAAAMDSDNVKNVILLGGTTAVSDSVVTQLQGLGYNVIRVAGPDRYGTNTALRAFASNTVGGTSNNPRGGLGYPAPTTPLLANGLGFADALTAGPLAAEGTRNNAAQAIDINQPLLLTSPAALSAPTAAYLSGNRATITKVTGVGLGAALPQSVLIAANNAAQSN